jgi:hypothetical protein
MRATTLIVLTTLLIALGFAASGCQQGRLSWGGVEASTVPPDLGYIPPERVRSAMWVIAAEIEQLERQLDAPGALDPDTRREAVRTALLRMRTAARRLSEPGRTSQHPVLNQNLPLFIERVERAIRAVELDPPSYFRASTLAGSCFLCHGESAART